MNGNIEATSFLITLNVLYFLGNFRFPFLYFTLCRDVSVYIYQCIWIRWHYITERYQINWTVSNYVKFIRKNFIQKVRNLPFRFPQEHTMSVVLYYRTLTLWCRWYFRSWGHRIIAPIGSYVKFFKSFNIFCFPGTHTTLGHSEPYSVFKKMFY